MNTDFIALDGGYSNTRLYGPKGGVILQSLVATDTLQVVNRWAAGNLKQMNARPLPVHTDTGEHCIGLAIKRALRTGPLAGLPPGAALIRTSAHEFDEFVS